MNIDVDIDAIRSVINKDFFEITDDESNYTDEWKTNGCIDTAFNSIETEMNNCMSLIEDLNQYLSTLESISDTTPPPIPDN